MGFFANFFINLFKSGRNEIKKQINENAGEIALQAEIDTRMQQYDKLNLKASELRRRIDAEDKTCAKVREEISSYVKAVSILSAKEKNAENDAKISTYLAKAEELKKSLDSKLDHYSSSKNVYDGIEATLAKMMNDITSMKQRIRDKQDRLVSARANEELLKLAAEAEEIRTGVGSSDIANFENIIENEIANSENRADSLKRKTETMKECGPEHDCVMATILSGEKEESLSVEERLAKLI